MSSTLSDYLSQFFICLCCFFPLAICVLGFPIYELCIGIIYRDDIASSTCSTMQIDISTWLIVNAVAAILGVLLVGICVLTNNKIIGMVLLSIFRVFIFAWLIVGSILFFRDCYNIEPVIVNVSMWVILIMGFLSIISSSKSDTIFNDDKNQKPLLDIC